MTRDARDREARGLDLGDAWAVFDEASFEYAELVSPPGNVRIALRMNPVAWCRRGRKCKARGIGCG